MIRNITIFIFLVLIETPAIAQFMGGLLIPSRQGEITSIICHSANNMGTLLMNVAASDISIFVPYTGGNGGAHNGQTVLSTGVTGLTATLTDGNFVNGSGSLTYIITGTPNAEGIANFALSVGSQNCNIAINVLSESSSPYPSNSIFCANGPTVVVEVTNPITGKIWMDRNLGATQVAISSTDVNSYGDLYQWGRRNDGHQCRTSPTTSQQASTIQPPHGNFILDDDDNGWLPNGNYDDTWFDSALNNPCPYGYRIPTRNELNAERLSWSTNNSAGAFASPLKLPLAGRRFSNSGIVQLGSGNYWITYENGANSATDNENIVRLLFSSSSGSTTFEDDKSNGFSVRCIKGNPAFLGGLNCGSTSTTGTLTSGIIASSVNSVVPYTGGNGGAHNGQTVTSTDVTGLTATLAAGSVAIGSGSLTYHITGMPSTAGIAKFFLNIGGKTCLLQLSVAAGTSLYPAGSVFCASGATAIVDVTNPTTGKIWMDRNLGASQAATSSTDVNSYGDLYQWGRGNDGHQCRTSTTTTTLSASDSPGNGYFILVTYDAPTDWRSPQNTNLWQGVNGVNNPCPSTYRLPTETEINAERLSWSQSNSAGAFASPLKLPMPGIRFYIDGSLMDFGTGGYYWSSTVSSAGSRFLILGSSMSYMSNNDRAMGYSVRCLKD